MDQPYPMDLRVPGSKDYSGRTDPEEHVNSYYGNMLMRGVSNAVMCQAFYSTLSGRAAEWFVSLEPGSITDFSKLARRFVHRFAISNAAKKHFTSLEKAKQREGESLTLFSERWKAAMAEIEPVDDRTAVNLLLYALRAGPLYQDLILKQPNTYEEALKRMTDHAIADEANAAKRMQETGQGRRDMRRQPDPRRKDQDGNPIYTPLSRPIGEILEYAQSCNMIQLPAPARDGPDKDKYCAYHRNWGHETDECHVLKGLIEDLLRSGELAQFSAQKKKSQRRVWKKYFKKSDKEKKDKGPEPDHDPPAARSKQIIHVIFGGPEGGDDPDQRRAWSRDLPVCSISTDQPEKRMKDEPITFTDRDLPLGGNQSTEALVVTIDICGAEVRRVMVDTGSSVNVLYLEAFRKLKLESSALRPVRTPLSGFTGDMIHPEGVVALPVEVRVYPRVLKVEMEFIVVNLACVHNVILGRPGIAQMRAIIFMPHLCMKFPTPEGVGVVRGDPRSARLCYVRAVEKQAASTSRANTIARRKDEEKKEQPGPSEPVEEIPLNMDQPDRCIKIGTSLCPDLKRSILSVLR
ncbi:uncharacterized protein LOC116001256 [Ipomoea triloba]|uniref:uncharacterized protein LOC116001256 n=1 Tax=Ipomoea triloba TaxID=35885 RepID=UPI00125CE207|nr:uncharacterized protein LOC116001256 [Ipomoea triloba]